MKNCILWFHKWNNWVDDQVVELKETEIYVAKTVRNVGVMLIQKRRCQRCNRVQLASIKTK